jgi:hypothetical protein
MFGHLKREFGPVLRLRELHQLDLSGATGVSDRSAFPTICEEQWETGGASPEQASRRLERNTRETGMVWRRCRTTSLGWTRKGDSNAKIRTD